MAINEQASTEDQMDIALRLNDTLYANHASHVFTGFDGRCVNCDCRPYGRHAPEPCPVNW